MNGDCGSTRALTRRGLFLRAGGVAALAVAGSAGLTACGNDTSALSGNQTNVSDYDQIITDGPVADDAAIQASPWAAAIKQPLAELLK